MTDENVQWHEPSALRARRFGSQTLIVFASLAGIGAVLLHQFGVNCIAGRTPGSARERMAIAIWAASLICAIYSIVLGIKALRRHTSPWICLIIFPILILIFYTNLIVRHGENALL